MCRPRVNFSSNSVGSVPVSSASCCRLCEAWYPPVLSRFKKRSRCDGVSRSCMISLCVENARCSRRGLASRGPQCVLYQTHKHHLPELLIGDLIPVPWDMTDRRHQTVSSRVRRDFDDTGRAILAYAGQIFVSDHLVRVRFVLVSQIEVLPAFRLIPIDRGMS